MIKRIFIFLSGCIVACILLESVLRIGGYLCLSLQEQQNRTALAKKKIYRVLCLGESTTLQYPRYLEEYLNSHPPAQFSVINKGRAGITTDGIVGRLPAYLDAYFPDIVVVMMGINDQFGHLYSDPVQDVKKKFSWWYSLKIAKLFRLLKKRVMEVSSTALSRRWHNPGWRSDLPLAGQDPFFCKTPPGSFSAALDIRGPGTGHQDVQRDRVQPPEENIFLLKGKEALTCGNETAAERFFMQGIEADPHNTLNYIELALLYKQQEKLAAAEDALKKSIASDLRLSIGYVQLATLYFEQGRYAEIEPLFQEGTARNLENESCYLYHLGRWYVKQGKKAQAEAAFKKGITLAAENLTDIYKELGFLYRSESRYTEAEAVLKEGIARFPRDDSLRHALENMYAESKRAPGIVSKTTEGGHFEPAETLSGRVAEQQYQENTKQNFLRLKKILDGRKIPLVCVQYPMRSVRPLKEIFKNDARRVIFVDNERLFRDAVARENVWAYFQDMFGGDFGHCTSKGDRLLARNIARALLKEAAVP